MGRNKEQSARMLDHLVVNAPRLIRPYMEPILKVLVPKLKELEPNPGVVISVLTCIGDLAEVSIGAGSTLIVVKGLTNNQTFKCYCIHYLRCYTDIKTVDQYHGDFWHS